VFSSWRLFCRFLQKHQNPNLLHAIVDFLQGIQHFQIPEVGSGQVFNIQLANKYNTRNNE
jgi:hypothetical protein